MKKHLLLFISIFLGISLAYPQYQRNQQIKAAEYFFNLDPGVGKGTPIAITQGSDVSLNLNSLNVAVGTKIYVRIQSTNGFWSVPRSIKSMNYFVTTGAIVQYGEYYIITDPGQGKATPINFTSGAASLINQNLHQGDIVYFRIKDSYNRWSPTRGFKYNYKAMLRAEYKIKLASSGIFSNPVSFNVTPSTDATCPYSGVKSNITWHPKDTIYVRYQSIEGFYSNSPPWKMGIIANAGNDQKICYGTEATLTAYGGSSYQWSDGQAGSTIIVRPNSTTNYVVTVTDGIGAISKDTVIVTVNPNILASVSITASPSGEICAGTNVTLTATPINGGSPTYQWKKGSTSITGATNSTYISSSPANGDLMTCVMTSTATCANGSPATSNAISLLVKPILPVSVIIEANPAGAIFAETSVTFTATPTNGGNPTYQWKNKGENIVGATNSTYTSNTLENGDIISCLVTSNVNCATGSPALSNAITVKQDGPAPFLTVSRNVITIATPANSVNTFDIASNIVWTAVSNQTWLTLNNNAGTGYASITIMATENQNISARNATVTIAGKGATEKTITVTQSGATPVLTVSANTLTVASLMNSTKTFDITSNINWTTSINQTWLTIGSTNGTGNATITLTTSSANPTISTRTAIVTISGTNVSTQTITVTQDGGTTGIKDYTENDYEIYPNPTSNILFFNSNVKNSLISIFDLNGKIVLTEQINNNQVNISDLHNGIYTIKIFDKSGVVIKKFVKQ